MQDEPDLKRYIIDVDNLLTEYPQYPTHRHPAEFWEALGRTVATFGFLEEVLGKAIFSFTATREYPEEELEAAFEKWLPTLPRMLSDPLGSLIDRYDNAVRKNSKATISNLDELLNDLRAASILRNVLCHGSWRCPDEQGRSVPLFVDRKNRIFNTRIDIAYLTKVRRDAVRLICAVLSTVSHMGWQVPGSNGPGSPILELQIRE